MATGHTAFEATVFCLGSILVSFPSVRLISFATKALTRQNSTIRQHCCYLSTKQDLSRHASNSKAKVITDAPLPNDAIAKEHPTTVCLALVTEYLAYAVEERIITTYFSFTIAFGPEIPAKITFTNSMITT